MSDGAQNVVVALRGGLGNQLFGYAAGLSLAGRLGCSLVLDVSAYEDPRERHYALAPFGLPERTARFDTTIFSRGSLPDRILRRLKRRLGWRQRGLPVFSEAGFNFDRRFEALVAPVFLDGYFQTPRYFEDQATALRARLQSAQAKLSAESAGVLQQIQGCDAICLHVRRGDYVTNPEANKTHGLCELDYYYEGVKIVAQGLSMPHCFVFSNDPQWVRQNMQLSHPMTVVDVNGEDAAHEDLLLMAACHSFVVANSSLSWWGAWLGQHPSKRVVAPRQWFRDPDKDTSDLIPADWIRI